MKTILACLTALMFLANGLAYAGTYLNSAHGTYVDRVGLDDPTDFGYPVGHCAHCHEQHASIEGAEPAPASGSPTQYLIFKPGSSQANSFCYRCHRDSSDQISMPAQYNYSHMAGGDSNACPDSVKDGFQFVDSTTGDSQANCSSSYGSSHFLDDIKTFLQSKWGWGATVYPCSACHNPHRAQKDPHTSSGRIDGEGKLVTAVSRPSDHADLTAWELWGDDDGDVDKERMDEYSSNYQAPLRADSGYEPDGSATQDGSNLVNYVGLCTDCHNATNTIYSNVLDRNLKTVDWENEKHGKGNANGWITVGSPYTAGDTALGYVLSCMDCHEPHGSPNVMLIRKEVNGAALDTITTVTSTDCTAPYSDHNKELGFLCNRCHEDDLDHYGGVAANRWYWVHHESSDRPYQPTKCGDCHVGGGQSGYNSTRGPINCNCCHYHGSSAASRRTF